MALAHSIVTWAGSTITLAGLAMVLAALAMALGVLIRIRSDFAKTLADDIKALTKYRGTGKL
jgi:hypothetical protein